MALTLSGLVGGYGSRRPHDRDEFNPKAGDARYHPAHRLADIDGFKIEEYVLSLGFNEFIDEVSQALSKEMPTNLVKGDLFAQLAPHDAGLVEIRHTKRHDQMIARLFRVRTNSSRRRASHLPLRISKPHTDLRMKRPR